MSLKGKLNRFKSHLTTDKPVRQETKIEKLDADFLQKWEAMQAKPIHFDGDYAIVREVSYPLDHIHGRYRFSELEGVVDQWHSSESEHPLSAKNLQTNKLLFFDTETTGLGTGTGNTIFLLGYSRVLSDRVIVKQFFLPSPSGEAALFHSFLAEVEEMRNLVTYNGKAFDWPQVKTRHTLLRKAVPSLPKFGHFDLLHGSRRMWKGTLESTRLSVVESEILGFSRENDTPGHLVPLIYFEYLRTKDPLLVQGILEHNEHDLLSLITLYIHLSHLILKKDLSSATTKELYEIGRWYDYLGQQPEAIECFIKIANTESRETILAKKRLAMIYKKQKRYEEALELWKDIEEIETFSDTSVLIEIAKVYEHQFKNVENALYYAKRAYRLQKQKKYLLKHEKDRELKDYLTRINRLERKCQLS